MTIDPHPGLCCGTDAACVFTKALLVRQAGCSLACRQAVGEADLVCCADRSAQQRCQRWLDTLRERAGFALKLRRGVPLRHAQALQLQCGGLLGLQAALDAAQATVVAGPPDVAPLLARLDAETAMGDDLPWRQIVASVVAWQSRRRGTPGSPS